MLNRLQRIRVGHGTELSDAEVRQMWDLRESVVQLKPERDREQLWSSFRTMIADSPAVGRSSDGQGRLLAMLSFRVADLAFRGQPVRLLLGGVGFVAREARSDPLVAAMYVGTFVTGITWRPGVRHFLTAVAYPVSAVRIGGYNERLLMPGLPDLEPIERFVLDEVRARLVGDDWDEDRGAVDMPTIPEPLSEQWLARQRDLPAYRQYIEHLPDWEAGFGLPVAIEVFPWKVYRGLGPVARRMWRTLLERTNLRRERPS